MYVGEHNCGIVFNCAAGLYFILQYERIFFQAQEAYTSRKENDQSITNSLKINASI